MRLRPTISERMQPRRRRSLVLRSSRMTVKIVVIVAIVATIVPATAGSVALGTLLFARLPGSLPDQKPDFQALPSTVYDAAGNEIGVFTGFDLTVPVSKADIPQVVRDAVVAAEDHRFWEHRGVDLQGVARAAWVNYQGGETLQGGSTITQQYIKNAYLTSDRTVSRKLREALLATQLERRMAKDEILFHYLDTVYFGSGAYGIGAAAQVYFGKSVRDLNLSEAALLAGLIPAPHAWSPRTSPEDAELRRQIVLRTMSELGWITPAEYDDAREQVVWLSSQGPPTGPVTYIQPMPPKGAFAYPYFVDWVEQYLLRKYGAEVLYRGGLRVETTIDPTMQQLAEAAVRDRLAQTDPSVEMALVAVQPGTGHVKAMVGGRDWNASQVNLAIGGSMGFQGGSAFKTFTLAAALSTGRFTADTVIPAPAQVVVPGCDGPDCTIKNAGGGGYGSTTLRTATASSINTAYVNLLMRVGIAPVAEISHRLGISTIAPDGDYGLSLTLGAYEVTPLDMASAYGVFANDGVRQEPTGVLRVIDSSGRVLEDNTSRAGIRALPTGVATTVTDMLRDVITSGTGRAANIGRPAAGKTGTTDNYSDAWFVGYTPQLSTAVWMGHRDEVRSLGSVTGGSHPAMAFSAFMRPAHEGIPPADFSPPGPLPQAVGPANDPTGVVNPLAPIGSNRRDDTIRPGRAGEVLETPTDCGGPCRL